MNAERLERVKSLHTEALSLEEGARAAFLDEACAEDTELRREVESLLHARESMGGFLETPATERVGRVVRAALEPGACVGQYEVVSVLGSGGGGIVYEAQQKNPRRTVALKVMQAGVGGHRFRDEAQILARLQHPGIATVFEAGLHEGDVAWFAMEHLEGARPIHEVAGGPRARLALMADVCDAVHHGHSKGVLHRDIKPGNILVDRAGRPKVIDFGIAKLTEDEAPEAGFAGTLPYGNPRGHEPDVRTDIYSLGVVLYEMLTGRPPWDIAGDPFQEAVRKIRSEPVAPTGLGADIDAIVNKALADDGYVSAAALADDIRRYLTHRPVEARRAGSLYHIGKFARRQRVAFGALAALVVVSIAAAMVLGWFAMDKERQRAAAEFEAYVANLAAAEAALRVDDVAEARRRLESTPKRLRNWEWRHLYGRLDASARTIRTGHINFAGAVSGDGTVWAAGGDAHLTIGSVATGETILRFEGEGYITAIALDGDGTKVALGYGGQVGNERGRALVVHDGRTGEVLFRTKGHESDVNALRFDPRGRWLASASRDGTVRIWDAETGASARTLRGHQDRVVCLAFHGGRLASGGRMGSIRLWSPEGESVGELRGHDGSVDGIAFSPDGSRLASCGRDRTVRLWDLATSKLIATAYGHQAAVVAISFGSRIATASYDRTIRLWEPEQLRGDGVMRGHVGYLKDVRLLPNGGLISFSRDRTVKIWPPGAGDAVPTLRGHRDRVQIVALSDRHVASADQSGVVALWDPATRRLLRMWRPHDTKTTALAFREGGRVLLTQSMGHPARAWSVPACERLADPPSATAPAPPAAPPDEPGVKCAARSPDGSRRATAGIDGAVRLWDTKSRRQVLILHGHRYEIWCLAFSPDGKRLASGGGVVEGRDSIIRLWEAE